MSLAYIFARPGGAAILGSPYGHVAFGFEIAPGQAIVGGVEVKSGSISHVGNAMDFWAETTADPAVFMGTQAPYGLETRYDMCKILFVENPNVDAARAQIERIKSIDYNLLGQNCRTDTVQILEAFGVGGLPGGARPSGFFGAIHAPITPLGAPWPGLDLDFSIYTETDQFGLRDDPQANKDGYVADPTADENPKGESWPSPVIGSLLLRKGYAALFPERNYVGEPVILVAGSVVNFRAVPWPDVTIRSWYASSKPFDPALLAESADSISPRFATSSQRRNNYVGLGLPPHFSLPQQRGVIS